MPSNRYNHLVVVYVLPVVSVLLLLGSTATAFRTKKPQSTWLAMKASSPPPFPVRIAVVGGGNFGLALASVCARKGIPTTLLVRTEDVADSINYHHIHPRYMSDIVLPQKIRATTSAQNALSDATYIIHAVPVQYSRDFLNSVRNSFLPEFPS